MQRLLGGREMTGTEDFRKAMIPPHEGSRWDGERPGLMKRVENPRSFYVRVSMRKTTGAVVDAVEGLRWIPGGLPGELPKGAGVEEEDHVDEFGVGVCWNRQGEWVPEMPMLVFWRGRWRWRRRRRFGR